MAKAVPKPIYVLTGFLGSGKTTLLNRLLRKQSFANTLVIVNEFGEVALDHLLVEKSSDTILELSNGCLCCSIRGELVDTLKELDTVPFDRIIIETTGIADPMPIFQSLAAFADLTKLYRPASIITVYDALRGAALIEKHDEAYRQMLMADVIVVTKLDQVKEDHNVRESISALNSNALIVEDVEEISPKQLDAIGHFDYQDHAAHPEHAQQYYSTVWKSENRLSLNLVAGMLHHLSNVLGDDLLRIKGFVNLDDENSKPVLVQMSGYVLHEFSAAEKVPDEFSETKLVVITKGNHRQTVQALFNSFAGSPEIDTPDRNAIMDNPLAIPGMG